MTNKLDGLKSYDKKAKKQFSFDRFQWVLPGTLARSSAPGYRGGDREHTVKPFDVGFLRGNQIVCVISANEYELDKKGRESLARVGIEFHHFGLADFGAPTPKRLREIADLIEACRNRSKNPGATLIYCGFGQGRTGTYVAGWAMLNRLANRPDKNTMCSLSFLKMHFGVEEPAQAQAIKAVATGKKLSEVSMPAVFSGIAALGSGPVTLPLPPSSGASFTGPKPYSSGFSTIEF